MILLSKENLDVNSSIEQNKFVNNRTIMMIDSIDELSHKDFFSKSIINFSSSYDIESIDSMFISGYEIKIYDNTIYLKNKISLKKYIENILIDLSNKDFDFYYHTPEYIYLLLKNNEELLCVTSEYPQLISNIFKRSLNESIYSISSINKCLNLFKDISFLKEDSFLLNYIESQCNNCFLTENIILELIEFSKMFQLPILSKLNNIKEMKEKELSEKNPFK